MGPKHLFHLMKLIKTQSPEVSFSFVGWIIIEMFMGLFAFQVQDIVKPVCQHNAFYALPEVLVATMLEDDRVFVRRVGVELIKKARRNPPKVPVAKLAQGIRFNKIPSLNWEATDWTEMINISDVKFFEPAVTRNLSDEDISDIVERPACFEKFPVHSQSVERAVKLVTESASCVYGQDRRHGFILNKVASRRRRTDFLSKKYYSIKNV